MWVDANAVRNFVEAFAPGTQDVAFAIHDEDWIGFLSALQKIDSSLRVERDRRDHAGFPIGIGRLDDEVRRDERQLRERLDHRAQCSGGLGASVLIWSAGVLGKYRWKTEQKREKSDGHGRIVPIFT